MEITQEMLGDTIDDALDDESTEAETDEMVSNANQSITINQVHASLTLLVVSAKGSSHYMPAMLLITLPCGSETVCLYVLLPTR